MWNCVVFNVKGHKENVLLTNKGMTQRTKSHQQSHSNSTISEGYFENDVSDNFSDDAIEILNNDAENDDNDEYIPSVVIMKRLLK